MTPGLRVAALIAAVAAAPPTVSRATSGGAREARDPPSRLVPETRPGAVLSLAAPGAEAILVPRGTFVMGSTDTDVLVALTDCQREPRGHQCEASQFADELPQRTITLSAFLLDRTEVTVRSYARCVAVGRCDALPLGEGARRFDQPNLPASLVTFQEARAYCAFRGARLPTEAEWERAARGPSGRRYPWGNLYNSHVVNHGQLGFTTSDASDGFAELAPVGSFPAGRTPEGFLDLSGNVAEWVEDRYAPKYDEAEVRDPRGPTSSTGTPARVVRGGSYESGAAWLRGASRAAADPSVRRPSIGFRCARSGPRNAGE